MVDFLKKERIVPVAVLEDADEAVDIANALLEGDVHSIEVTFRTKAAEEAIRRIAKECPQMLVGAGTILTVEQAKTAIAAGAKFLVSPALVPEVVEYALSQNIPMIPGCITPSEFMQAQNMGLSLVKFFPAQAYGGGNTLRTLASVFPNIWIMPTGGINLSNLKEYLECPNVCACGGSFMLDKKLLAAKDYAKVTELAKECQNV